MNQKKNIKQLSFFVHKKFQLSIVTNSLKIYFSSSHKSNYIWIDPPWYLYKKDKLVTDGSGYPADHNQKDFKIWCSLFSDFRKKIFESYEWDKMY